MIEIIKSSIFENSMLSSSLLNDDVFLKNLENIANKTIETLLRGNRVFFAGNGGSASQAQHLAAELAGRFLIDRAPLDALCLSDNISFLTAVSNDYNYTKVFERALQAHGKKNDLLFLLSTSGSSQNIINARLKAKDLEIFTVACTGLNGIDFAVSCDMNITIPSAETSRIQEMHILCGHIICELTEQKIFSNE
jgi:D-sedoheptulose 7-phosphate isomerase